MISLHTANIAIHIVCATGALAIGACTLMRAKGDQPHRRRGRLFLALMAVVILTAAVGATLFRSSPTLVATTLLVTYQVVSGARAGSGARLEGIDVALSVLALLGGSGFSYFLISSAEEFWRPAVTGPIAGTLVAFAAYDLVRLAFPSWRARIFPLEHGVKMISAIGALASAGLGTLAPAWRPWSQIAPSVIMTVLALTYVVFRGPSTLRNLAPTSPDTQL